MMDTKLACLFPGQGSQSLGMLNDFANLPVVTNTFATASAVLGYDLWELIQTGPAELLNQTERTQPALLVSSVAIWRVWQSMKAPTPTVLAGHSLGEYSALVCAEALAFETAIALAADRGRFMQEAVVSGQGAMAAIVGLTDEQVTELCKEAAQNQIVAPANFNSIGQVVIAGETVAVERAIELAKQKGAKIAKLIPVSVPSHSELMKPAADRLAERLAKVTIDKPQIPIINNVDVSSYNSADEIRSGLTRQLCKPVRWVETIQTLSAQGIKTAIECGPGKVLTGLNKRIDANFITHPVNSPESLESALQALHAQVAN